MVKNGKQFKIFFYIKNDLMDYALIAKWAFT